VPMSAETSATTSELFAGPRTTGPKGLTGLTGPTSPKGPTGSGAWRSIGPTRADAVEAVPEEEVVRWYERLGAPWTPW
jgi:hypothetical protein